MNESPDPSRRRGRPPKIQPLHEVAEIAAESAANFKANILAPPQEPVTGQTITESGQLETHAPTVPSPLPKLEPPLPIVKADDVDLRENPEMAAKHSIDSSGSDSKVRGASDGYLPVEAGTALHTNPALPEQFESGGGPTTEMGLESGESRMNPSSITGTDARSHSSQELPEPAAVLSAPVSPWTPVQVGDVVQINSTRNKHIGTLFIVGDIKHHRVHGYQIGVGGKLEYFTVNEDECILVGSMSRGQIRARKGCSAKWAADNR